MTWPRWLESVSTQRRRGRDLDLLGDLADRHLQIDAQPRADLRPGRCPQRHREAGLLGGHDVDAGPDGRRTRSCRRRPVVLTTEMPVPALVSVTFAPGTTAPDVSRTVPTTVAVSNCASAGAAPSVRSQDTNTRDRRQMHNLRGTISRHRTTVQDDAQIATHDAKRQGKRRPEAAGTAGGRGRSERRRDAARADDATAVAGDEPVRVERQQRRGSDAALVADQAAERARYGSGDPRGAAAEAHVTHQPGQLRHADEEQQAAEHDRQRAAGGVRVQQRADQSAGGAGQAEPEEDAPVDMAAEQPESQRRADHVRDRHRGDRELGVERAARAAASGRCRCRTPPRTRSFRQAQPRPRPRLKPHAAV